MLKAGRNYTLAVSRISEFGLYLQDEEGQEVLLPNRYTSLTDQVGDKKEIFVYHDKVRHGAGSDPDGGVRPFFPPWRRYPPEDGPA